MFQRIIIQFKEKVMDKRERKEYFKRYYLINRERILARQNLYAKTISQGNEWTPLKKENKERVDEPYIDLYNTREELQEAIYRGEGNINWDKWNLLVEKTKKDIDEELKDKEDYLFPNGRKKKIRYIYNKDGQLIAQGTTNELIAVFLRNYNIRLAATTIVKYSNLNLNKDGLYFTNKKRNDNNAKEREKTNLCL